MNSLKTVLCLHAQAEDLGFLNPVKTRIGRLLGKSLHVINLDTQASHVEALLALRKTAEGLVIIFAHGSCDYLRGGEYRSRALEETIQTEKFLTRNDAAAFKDKVVFCMSCDSNGLAPSCLEAGALAFVGFDDIQFRRFDLQGEEIKTGPLMGHCQALIAEAAQVSLERFILGRATLDESVEFMRLWIVQKTITYVRRMEKSGVKERKEVAALLLKFKSGMRYHGPRGIRFERRSNQ